jgi:hypothetical protein
VSPISRPQRWIFTTAAVIDSSVHSNSFGVLMNSSRTAAVSQLNVSPLRRTGEMRFRASCVSSVRAMT